MCAIPRFQNSYPTHITMKLFAIICFVFSLFMSNSFAQSEEQKLKALREYRVLSGLTGKPEDVLPKITWISNQMIIGENKFAGRTWNEHEKCYELKIGARVLHVYLDDKKQLKKISIIKEIHTSYRYIFPELPPTNHVEYMKLVGDSKGNVIEGRLTPTREELEKAQKPDWHKPEGIEHWQYEFESEMRNIKTGLDTFNK